MGIEKIACERLSKKLGFVFEVFVEFRKTIEELYRPAGIMCNHYDSENGTCNLVEEDCTFAEWKTLYSEEERKRRRK